MPDFIKRIERELEDLDEKLGKLRGFIASEKIKEVSNKHAGLLVGQATAMTNYSRILAERLALLKKE